MGCKYTDKDRRCDCLARGILTFTGISLLIGFGFLVVKHISIAIAVVMTVSILWAHNRLKD